MLSLPLIAEPPELVSGWSHAALISATSSDAPRSSAGSPDSPALASASDPMESLAGQQGWPEPAWSLGSVIQTE